MYLICFSFNSYNHSECAIGNLSIQMKKTVTDVTKVTCLVSGRAGT